MYSTALIEDLREAAATFGNSDPIDDWEARRRELAAFYAANRRRPRRHALNTSERKLAAWAERQMHPRGGLRRARNLMLLQMTPGWWAVSSANRPSGARRSTYRPSR